MQAQRCALPPLIIIRLHLFLYESDPLYHLAEIVFKDKACLGYYYLEPMGVRSIPRVSFEELSKVDHDVATLDLYDSPRASND